MLPITTTGSSTPALVLLHFFAGSQREWAEVVPLLAAHYQCITMDLPGFGEANSTHGYAVEEMTEQVSKTLQGLGLSSFIFVGHSMSGKVGLALAASGEPDLVGLVLVTPSPPSPEPMKESDRQKMLSFERTRADGEEYLDGITAHPLTGQVRERAIQDFIRSSPEAWTAWLESGSKEDWSERVGVIECPALIVAGETDPSLAAPVQEQLTLPHLRHGEIQVIDSCGHLPMMEAPEELASLILKFANETVTNADIADKEGLGA